MANKFTSSPVQTNVRSTKGNISCFFRAVLKQRMYQRACSNLFFFFGVKVEAESVVIEADDVAEGISGEIAKLSISKLVIGASSRNMFSR